MKLKDAICSTRLGKCAQILYNPNRICDPKGKRTYYPELPHKGKWEIVSDFLKCALSRNILLDDNEYYCVGLDRKGEKLEDHVPGPAHQNQLLSVVQKPLPGQRHNYMCVPDDKYLFAVVADSYGLPIPKTFGMYANGQIFVPALKKYIPLEEIVNYDLDVMFKPISGTFGYGIVHIVIKDKKIMRSGKELSMSEFQSLLDKGINKKHHTATFIIQDFVGNQHHDMKRMFPNSLNTLRVSVAKNPETGEYDVLGLMCLMGAGDMIVSNWHFGGVVVNVLPDGHLDRYGFSNAHKRVERHPDTGVVFSEIKIPFFEETIELAKKATAMFYGHRTIGWDFAFTEDGPVIIEANNTWGVVAHEMVEGRGYAAIDRKYFGLK